MSGSATKVEESSLSQHNDAVASRELETLNLRLNLVFLDTRPAGKTVIVNFIVKVTDVSNNSVVFHLSHVFSHNNILVSGGGDEDISLLKNILQANNLESPHACLKSADRINFSDVYSSTAANHSFSTSFADISESANDNFFTSNHDISSSEETIRERVSASIDVVELRLGNRVINVNGREREFSFLGNLVKTVNTGGGFLWNTSKSLHDSSPSFRVFRDGSLQDSVKVLLVFSWVLLRIRKLFSFLIDLLPFSTFQNHHSGITTIVNKNIWSLVIREVESFKSKIPVFLEGFSLPCEDLCSSCSGNSRGSVVLSREDIARAPSDISTELLESLNEDTSLNGHVQRTSDSGSLQDLLRSEFGSARHESWHFDFSDVKLFSAVGSKLNVFNSISVDEAHSLFALFCFFIILDFLLKFDNYEILNSTLSYL